MHLVRKILMLTVLGLTVASSPVLAAEIDVAPAEPAVAAVATAESPAPSCGPESAETAVTSTVPEGARWMTDYTPCEGVWGCPKACCIAYIDCVDACPPGEFCFYCNQQRHQCLAGCAP